MKFIGLDFGWRTQPTGLCCLQLDGSALQLVALDRWMDLADILAWVDRYLPAPEPGGVAVDAPTLIPNPRGMRLCDRLTHHYFGRYHAGCYPANLGSPFAERTLALGRELETRGFAHAPTILARQPQRFQIEVFPHPATIRLFHLPQILKYKKGAIAARRGELIRLRDYLLQVLPSLQPSLTLSPSQLPEVPATGKALKALEDQLDSLICAYVAAHWWYWGETQNQVLGDGTTGYIVVPGRPSNG